VSNYRIERLIGIGGAAVVYEARPLLPGGDGPPVACKLMRAERRVDPVTRALVKQEAALGLRITPGHPNLARVLDCFEDAGEGPCIVMELVDGGSLKALLGPDRRLPFPITRRILGEVLQALAHLHDVDVLHRDLSPCNILISTTGSVKIADLGIARVMEQGHTYTKNYRGKLAYDSPEAIQTRTLDARSDLYTLGAVLYELLAGTPPCGEAEAFADVVIRTLRGDFAPLPPETPADLAELTMGLLRTERDVREPRTAAEALALLRSHDQPMASQAELAALVMDMKSRRGTEPDGAHRAPALAPGELLEAGDVLIARTALAPGEAMPDAEAAQPPAPARPLVFPLPPEPPLPSLPQPPRRVTVQLAKAGPGSSSPRRARLDGAAPGRIHVVQQPARRPRSSRPVRVVSRSHLRHEVMYRAVVGALLGVCVLASGFLLHDRFRGERAAGSAPPQPAMPAPVVGPALLVAPAPVPVRREAPVIREQTGRPAERPHVTERAEDPHRARIETQRGRRRTGAVPARRPEPLGGEPPSWAAP
jgi:serine/threonine protein kinase